MILRLAVGILLLGGLAVQVMDLRSEEVRRAYRRRGLLEEQAAVRNKLRHLEGQVLVLANPPGLISRAGRMGVVVGSRGGPVESAPPPRQGPGPQ